MDDYTIEVVTQFNKDMIEQWDEYGKGFNLSPLHEHTKRLIQLQEQGIRDALKKLGYLDPQQSAELISALDNLCVTYRMRTGLDGAWDSELIEAQNLLKKYEK